MFLVGFSRLVLALVLWPVLLAAQSAPLAPNTLNLRPGLIPIWPPVQTPAVTAPRGFAEYPADGQNVQGRSTYTDEKRQSRKGLYLGAALAVVGGTVAWWSKREADNAYDQYLRSANPKRQASKIDRARRFDRIAGGAYALMEAGVVLSVYFTFLDKR